MSFCCLELRSLVFLIQVGSCTSSGQLQTYAANQFAKRSDQRHMSLSERKQAMIREARLRYIEKHELSVTIEHIECGEFWSACLGSSLFEFCVMGSYDGMSSKFLLVDFVNLQGMCACIYILVIHLEITSADVPSTGKFVRICLHLMKFCIDWDQ